MNYNEVTLHPECAISPSANIIGDVTIGKNVSIFAGATLRGDYGAEILVGDNTNIQEGCCVHVGNDQPAIIGKGVTIGHGAIVHGCTIGDNTLIGMGATVMDAAVIGNNCIIGAGALVTGGTQIPSGSLVLGSPARVKRPLTAQEIEANKKSAYEYIRIGKDMAAQHLMHAALSHPTVPIRLAEKLDIAKRYLVAKLGGFTPEIGIILGSGLNFYAANVEGAITISYEDVPFMRKSTAAGHVGQFVFGTIAGKNVCVMQGRIHAYEGASSQDVAFPVWLMSKLGVTTLITCNATGALNRAFKPGEFCVMTDQINLTGRNPLACEDALELGERFISMKDAFDANLRGIALSVAAQHDITLHKGVYLGVLGPSFETPAEIRLFEHFGADTIAMSVVEEVTAARQMNMRVLGISLIANMGCGIDDANPSDAEVRETGSAHEAEFTTLVSGILNNLY